MINAAGEKTASGANRDLHNKKLRSVPQFRTTNFNLFCDTDLTSEHTISFHTQSTFETIYFEYH